MSKQINLAYFISSHGFGHAARSSAIMAALSEKYDKIHFELFTEVPEWFFLDSLPESIFSVHKVKTDIGLVQKSPLEEDLPATIDELTDFIPFGQSLLRSLSEEIKLLQCSAVLCDISPLGLAVGRESGLPALLIENFTWDWIYEGYEDYKWDFNPLIDELKKYFGFADFRLQTEPMCDMKTHTCIVNPVSRPPIHNAEVIRKKLNINPECKVVLITLGGIPSKHDYISELKKLKDIIFILPINVDRQSRDGNCIILPHHSEYYHPDLVSASHAVIGKLGYSTLSEVYHAGIPYGFITRDSFRESIPLSRFVEQKMPHLHIKQEQFLQGSWIESIPELLKIKPVHRNEENGSAQAAEAICNFLKLG